jgi:hypothetical protein
VQRLGQLSPDGSKYWDSQQWVSAISHDGNWRWNGRSWSSVAAAEGTDPPANVLAAATAGSGFFHFHGFQGAGRSTVALVAALLLFQLVMSAAAFELGVRSTGLQRQIAALPGPPNLWPAQPTPQVSVTSPSPVVAIRTPAPKPPALSPRPTPLPLPTPSPTPPPTCGAPPNPFGYDFCPPAALIYKPASNFCKYFACIPAFWISTNGYVVECVDQTYSHTGGHLGACFNHGGMRRPLYS